MIRAWKAALAGLTLTVCAATTAGAMTLDFDDLGFMSGDVVTGQTLLGITLSVANQGTTDGDPRELMLFDAECGGDANNCSGGDEDLFAPGEGLVLIISEDNDSADPDDSRFGGDIIFDFAEAVPVVSLLLDLDEGATVSTLIGGVLIESVDLTTGNGGMTTVEFLMTDTADQIVVSLNGSGAVASLTISPIPLPASLPMMLLAIGGLAAVRSRR
ncbi:MAG: VPLPA-CTERM sorting domain-containing protein [Pseudomonadota bacterium]